MVFAKSCREDSTKQAKNVNPHLVGFVGAELPFLFHRPVSWFSAGFSAGFL